jgi:hypothetical protein
VIRLPCGHIFHYECWRNQRMTPGAANRDMRERCPNCRGSAATPVGRWYYELADPLNDSHTQGGPNSVQDNAEHRQLTPAASERSASRGSRSADSAHVPDSARSTSSRGGAQRPRHSNTSDANPPSSSGLRQRPHSQGSQHSTRNSDCFVITGDSKWGCETFLNGATDEAKALIENRKQGSGHSDTVLEDGTVGMLVDIGSVGNLSGDRWLMSLCKKIVDSGRSKNVIEQIQRDKPLNVSGVGKGAEICNFNTHLPIAVPTTEGTMKALLKVPTVPNSDLPGLLGLQSLKNSRTIIDTNTNKLYMVGPGDYDLAKLLPPGTVTIQLKESPSGHLMMPCDSFQQFDKEQKHGGLTIDRQMVLPVTQNQD